MTTEPRERALSLPEPLDALRTALGARPPIGDPSFRRLGDEVWRASRTPEGDGTLRLRQRGARLEAWAWGPGADWLLDRLPALVGLEDRHWSGFRPEDPTLAALWRRHRGVRLGANGRLFDTLVPVILGQKVLGKEASGSYRRLLLRYGKAAPGPAPGGRPLPLPVDPETLRTLAYEHFHPLGVERKRAEVVLRVARRSGRVDSLVGPNREGAAAEATRRLCSIPGVGPWTAAKALAAATGDPDLVAVGDYNLPSLVTWNLAGERRGDDARMLELLEPYRGHRARVVRLLELGGRTPPRRGPRLPFQRIERI